MDPDPQPDQSQPPVINYVLSFLLVGLAWGFTTPFIRRAAKDFGEAQERRQRRRRSDNGNGNFHDSTDDTEEQQGEEHEMLLEGEVEGQRQRPGEVEDDEEDATIPPSTSPSATTVSRKAWMKVKIVTNFWTVVNLLRTPSYLIPLVLNLTGSVWFFLLVGKHGMSPHSLYMYVMMLMLYLSVYC